MPPLFPESLKEDLQAVQNIIYSEMKLRYGRVTDLVSIRNEHFLYQVRPAFLLATARAYGFNGEKAVGVAAVIQFICLATQVHEQVEDQKADINTADFQFPVLVGDYLYSQYFLQLCQYDAVEYLKPLSRVVCEIHEGGILKQQLSRDECLTMEMLYKEEGALLEEACKIGASIAGAPVTGQELFARFGKQIGLALGALKHGYEKPWIISEIVKAKEILKDSPVDVQELTQLCDFLLAL